MDNQTYEIVKFVDNGFELEVNVSPLEDTVWLTQEQMAALFETTKQNISLHVSNILNDNELENRTVKYFLTVQKEGDRNVRRSVKFYNLDMIISVGFRVKSPRGIVFRRWANSTLKQYLLKGYAIDSSRVLVTPENYMNLVNIVNRIDDTQTQIVSRIDKLEENYPQLVNKLFYKGQLWDALICIETIIKQAKESIVLIDGYVDEITLEILSKKKNRIPVTIYTYKQSCKLTEKEIEDFSAQYGKLEIKYSNEFHDRFLILDKKELYHIGASIKDAGKKGFAIFEDTERDVLKTIMQKLCNV